MAKKLPLISVVVCSLNGGDVISDALKAIKAQKWAGKLEIIVVDDGSTDGTYKIAKSFKGVKVIKNKVNLGIASSRNVGIKAAKGEIIAFTDDDCRPQSTWIKELYAGFASDKVLAVGGDTISNDRSSLTLRYLSVHQLYKPIDNKILKSRNPFYRFSLYIKDLLGMSSPVPNLKRSVYSLGAGNISFRKSALKEIGTFDKRFVFAAEDVDLCKRLNNAYPEGLWYSPKAKVIHQVDSDLKDTLRRSKAYGIGDAQLFHKHKDFIPAIYPFPPFILLSFLLGFINPWFLLTPFILIPIIYSLGIRTAIKNRSLEPVLYGYIQYLQELCSNFGFISGWWKFRNTFSETTKQSRPLLARKTESTIPDDSFMSKGFNFSIGTREDIVEKLPERNDKFKLEAGIIFIILGLVLIDSLMKSFALFHVPSAIVIVLLSGYLLLRGFGAERQHRLPGMLRLALSTTAGIAWIMFFGLIADVVLPAFGFKHPLTTDWLPLFFVIATGLLIPWSLRYKIAVKKVSNFMFNWDTFALGSVLILTLLFSFCGARLLNNGYSNVPIIISFVLGLVSIILVLLRYKHLPKNMFPIVLFVLSLASVWSYSLRSNYVFGWDIQQEFQVFKTTLESGRWMLGAKHTSYPAMLSLTILPVTIVKITGVAGLTMFKFIYAIFYSFVPVILYYIYRLFTKRWISFIASLLVISQVFYAQELSHAVRQQIAFLFFASILYLILENRLIHRTKNYLLVVSILGLVVSHYTTTYFAIIFLGGTYIVSKVVYVLLRRYWGKGIESQNWYIHGWVIIILIVSTVLWYGPATHSSGYLQDITSKQTYSNLLHRVESFGRHKQSYVPTSTESYLQNIGKQYHSQHKQLTYYSGASNTTIHPVAQTTIHVRSYLLKKFVDGFEYLLSNGWWALGSIGILALIVGAIKRFGYLKLEIGILGAIGLTSIMAFELFPTLQNHYDVARIEEQVLMITALPSILMIIWFLRKLFSAKITKLIATILICWSFAFVSGIIFQFAGGPPLTNLNNSGEYYNEFYIYQSDIAASKWLGTQYNSSSIVYADSYSGLRLTSDNNINRGQLYDVTPETIAVGSFVYADFSNVRLGVADVASNNSVFTYQFPTTFLQQNKNLVYSNGYSEVYK